VHGEDKDMASSRESVCNLKEASLDVALVGICSMWGALILLSPGSPITALLRWEHSSNNINLLLFDFQGDKGVEVDWVKLLE